MNTIALWQRFRWMYVPASLLTFLLQRSPVLRLLGTAEFSAGSPAGALLRSAVTVAALGGYHTLAGATQLSTNPSSPATATVGQPFSMVFAFVGAPTSAGSYEIRGTLPPGLSIPGLSGDLLNSSSGTITGTPTVAGSYALSVRGWNNTNKRGDGGSITYTININVQAGAVAAPTITTQPASLSVNAGGAATFSVVATGGGTLSYQWTRDGVNISGATSSTLTLPSVSASSAGAYRVVVTGSGGTVTSQPATLTVVTAQAPTIVTSPLTQTVLEGARLTLSVDAAGTAPLSYQWKKAGATIVGATNSSLTLPDVRAADAASYTVTVSNAAGSVESAAANISVSPRLPTTITTQPSSISVRLGDTATFTVTATGAGTLSYQWTKDGAIIAGATGATLSLPSVNASSAGDYRVLVSGLGVDNFGTSGSVTSQPATLTVSDSLQAPRILTQPLTQTVVVGAYLTLSVDAAGSSPLRYQWLKSGNPILGATGPSITFDSVQSAVAAAYSVTVTNEAGTVVSNAATISVIPAVASAISNLSVRSRAGQGAGTLIVGFAMAGGIKPVLVRAVGPGLAAFNVPGTEVDPRLVLFDGGTSVASNEDWGGGSSLAAAFASVGAFPLVASSRDAAIVTAVVGSRTAHVGGQGDGIVLLELYDAGTGVSNRLTNVSTRAYVGSGADVLILGISISGRAPKTLLIRGWGPALREFGVSGTLADPKLELFDSSQIKIAENDNHSPSLAMAYPGYAFTPGSKDAALLVSLSPGVNGLAGYTIQLSGVAAGTGVGLIDATEVQP